MATMMPIATKSAASARPVFAHGRSHVVPQRSVVSHYRMGHYSESSAGPEDFNLAERSEAVATGIVFSPSAELVNTMPPLDKRMSQVGPSHVSKVSLGRMDFAQKAEAAINEQINVELNMSYFYLSASAYFARDNVGLPGFAAHYKYASDEERSHALRLIEFQTRRGGRVMLASLLPPASEFEHEEKGDALHAAEISLSLEKLNFAKLRELHSLGEDADDADMTHFVEDYLLDEQSRDVKEAAILVSQLQRAGKGLGVFTIDYALQKKYGVQGADAGLKNPDNNNGTGLAVTPLL